MGQEQSTEASIDRVTGCSAGSGKLDKIIVVRTAGDAPYDYDADANLKRLAELKSSEPILRSCLNKPNVKDGPEVYAAIDARPLLRIADTVQRHTAAQASAVSSQQNSLRRRIVEVDKTMTKLVYQLSERKRHAERAQHTFAEADRLKMQLESVRAALKSTVASAQSINASLPTAFRLPPLDLVKDAQTALSDDEVKMLPSATEATDTLFDSPVHSTPAATQNSKQPRASTSSIPPIDETRVVDR